MDLERFKHTFNSQEITNRERESANISDENLVGFLD